MLSEFVQSKTYMTRSAPLSNSLVIESYTSFPPKSKKKSSTSRSTLSKVMILEDTSAP